MRLRTSSAILVAAIVSAWLGSMPMSVAGDPSTQVVQARQLDDSTPVTDPKAYSPEYVERFTMLGTEYCVPRIASLRLHKPKDGSPSHGASAALDAVTLTNSNPPPWGAARRIPNGQGG